MTAIDGTSERLSSDPTQSRHTLLSVLPSIALHGALAAAVWLGFARPPEVIQPPVTFISLAPGLVSGPLEPLPPTGLRLPEPETAPRPSFDFAPPALPEQETFPFDPIATRAASAPEPEPVPIEKVEEEPKPPPEKPKEAKAKPKPAAMPEPKTEPAKIAKSRPTPAAAPAETKAAQNPPPSPVKPATEAAPPTATPANAMQSAAISDAPLRVTHPNYAGACPISYPERARRRNQEGTVVIHALIGPDGNPIEVTVAQSSGHSLLDEAARKAISHCAFVPQQVGGRAVKAIVEIPIPFKLI